MRPYPCTDQPPFAWCELDDVPIDGYAEYSSYIPYIMSRIAPYLLKYRWLPDRYPVYSRINGRACDPDPYEIKACAIWLLLPVSAASRHRARALKKSGRGRVGCILSACPAPLQEKDRLWAQRGQCAREVVRNAAICRRAEEMMPAPRCSTMSCTLACLSYARSSQFISEHLPTPVRATELLRKDGSERAT